MNAKHFKPGSLTVSRDRGKVTLLKAGGGALSTAKYNVVDV